jgi:hypothetical protein
MIWPFFLSPWREERWMATSDEEKPLIEVLGNVQCDTYLTPGDAVNMPNGELWVCTRGGSKDEAMVVRGRYKKPTELYK